MYQDIVKHECINIINVCTILLYGSYTLFFYVMLMYYCVSTYYHLIYVLRTIYLYVVDVSVSLAPVVNVINSNIMLNAAHIYDMCVSTYYHLIYVLRTIYLYVVDVSVSLAPSSMLLIAILC